jgi:hypothetical protein
MGANLRSGLFYWFLSDSGKPSAELSAEFRQSLHKSATDETTKGARAMQKVIEWNTGRTYTAEGQRIVATIRGGTVVFWDCARAICGECDCELTRPAIMACYDAGCYSHPARAWELPALLGLVESEGR